MVRLNKYLADCGVGSRRKCDLLILQGQILVNDQVESRLGVKIDERADRVKFDGRDVRPVKQVEYILLNKPKGYVTTVSDDMNRRTVMDLVKSKNRLFPVGRLDIDTTGLLLLTNDGELTYKLTHPKFQVEKVYAAILNKSLKPSDQDKLESGIELEEGRTSACTVRFPTPTDRKRVRLTLHQGWKRQIRRMFDVLDYEVLSLHRVSLSFLNVKALKEGEWRKLSKNEVEQLKSLF
ncbi:MAG: pseudouridine synthase [bacterium]